MCDEIIVSTPYKSRKFTNAPHQSMNNNKILGKRFIKSEEYLIHKAELDLKKHLWKRHKTLNEDLCDAAEDFEAAFAQRDYVDLLSVYRK